MFILFKSLFSRPTRTSSSQGHLKTVAGTTSANKRTTTVTNDELDNAYADTDLHNQSITTPKCDKCGQPIEYYNEECIGYCIIVCGTLVHREPAIAAPLLMDMIETIGRVAESHIYTWQENSTVVAPANSRSIAQQFIRCTFQQLAANNISYQFFQQNFRGMILSIKFKRKYFRFFIQMKNYYIQLLYH